MSQRRKQLQKRRYIRPLFRLRDTTYWIGNVRGNLNCGNITAQVSCAELLGNVQQKIAFDIKRKNAN